MPVEQNQFNNKPYILRLVQMNIKIIKMIKINELKSLATFNKIGNVTIEKFYKICITN